MTPALLVSITAMVTELSAAAVFFALSRAAGWRRSLFFALIAVTAALYAAMNMVACLPDVAAGVRRLSYHLSYGITAAHCILWILYARSAPETGRTALSTTDRAAIGALAAIGVVGAAPGVFVGDRVETLSLPEIGVTYWTVSTTTIGDLAGGVLVASFAIPISVFVARARRREPGARILVAGFVVLFACALNEILVVSGVYDFLFVADVGFGAVLIAVAIESVRRVLRDADALARLSNQLAGDALASRSERDEARAALVDAERLGHEINNPLAHLRHSLDELTQQLGSLDVPPAARDALVDAIEGTRRIDAAVRELRGVELRAVSVAPVPVPVPVAAAEPAPASASASASASAPAPASAPATEPAPEVLAPGSPPPPARVLVVDDDERVSRAIVRMLRGYEVTTAIHGRDALERIPGEDAFDAIVCDLSMPVMGGVELAQEIEQRWPALRARMLFVTGGAPGSGDFLARTDVRSLQKPFDPEALRRELESMGIPRPGR